MRTWNGGSSPKNMKRVILTFMLLHGNCTQPKAGRSNAVLSEQLRSPASHSCPPSPGPSHTCKSEVASCLLCTCSLEKKKKKKETIPSFYFLSSYVYFPHDRIARCKYKDRITTNACHMKVVLVYKNHIDYLKYVFERLYDYLLNFCAFKYHL